MQREQTYAIALLTQKQLDRLGGGLKKVYRIAESTDRFDALIRELDNLDTQLPC
jgi:hypothetical protein